jgi:hypothetical protein
MPALGDLLAQDAALVDVLEVGREIPDAVVLPLQRGASGAVEPAGASIGIAERRAGGKRGGGGSG